MNDSFIRIKGLEGELKLSYKKRDFGLTVSTKELVFQKPHVNYHMMLEDILSITPFELPLGARSIRFDSSRSSGTETVGLDPGMPHYRLFIRGATIHNRSGIFSLGAAQFILPIHEDLLMAISKYGGLNPIP